MEEVIKNNHNECVSFAVVAIPAEPIYSQVAETSLAINEHCVNNNIIDNKLFPCHLTLIISGTDKKSEDVIIENLQKINFSSLQAKVDSFYIEKDGLISILVKGEIVNKIHQEILDIIEKTLKDKIIIRPRIQERLSGLSDDEQKMVSCFGSHYVGEYFKPHISVAKVEKNFEEEAMNIAKNIIKLPQEIKFSEIQIVDIGLNNEQWNILKKISI